MLSRRARGARGRARKQPKTWRYAHFRSYATFEAKKAVLIAVLKRLHKMASDDKALVPSAIQKLHEFTNLEYPAKLIWTACTTLALTTRNPTWFKIRGAVRTQTKSTLGDDGVVSIPTV